MQGPVGPPRRSTARPPATAVSGGRTAVWLVNQGWQDRSTTDAQLERRRIVGFPWQGGGEDAGALPHHPSAELGEKKVRE